MKILQGGLRGLVLLLILFPLAGFTQGRPGSGGGTNITYTTNINSFSFGSNSVAAGANVTVTTNVTSSNIVYTVSSSASGSGSVTNAALTNIVSNPYKGYTNGATVAAGTNIVVTTNGTGPVVYTVNSTAVNSNQVIGEVSNYLLTDIIYINFESVSNLTNTGSFYIQPPISAVQYNSNGVMRGSSSVLITNSGSGDRLQAPTLDVGTINATGPVNMNYGYIQNYLTMLGGAGALGAGKVLTDLDGSGVASWQTPTGGSTTNITTTTVFVGTNQIYFTNECATTANADTNHIIVSGAGTAAANGTYDWGTASYINRAGVVGIWFDGADFLLTNSAGTVLYNNGTSFSTSPWDISGGAGPAPGSVFGTITNCVTVVGSTAPLQLPLISTNMYLDTARGNDTNAVRGRLDRPWKTIAGVLLASRAGDRILVAPGTYPFPTDGASLFLSNRCSIIGAGQGIVFIGTAGGAEDSLYVYSDTYLDGFTLQGKVVAGAGQQFGGAFGAWEATNLYIQNMTINGGADGLGLDTWRNVTVEDSTITSVYDAIANWDNRGLTQAAHIKNVNLISVANDSLSTMHGISWLAGKLFYDGGSITASNGSTMNGCVYIPISTNAPATMIFNGVRMDSATTNLYDLSFGTNPVVTAVVINSNAANVLIMGTAPIEITSALVNSTLTNRASDHIVAMTNANTGFTSGRTNKLINTASFGTNGWLAGKLRVTIYDKGATASGTNIWIVPFDGQKINGAAVTNIATDYGALTLMVGGPGGTNWVIEGAGSSTAGSSNYTTLSAGTLTVGTLGTAASWRLYAANSNYVEFNGGARIDTNSVILVETNGLAGVRVLRSTGIGTNQSYTVPLGTGMFTNDGTGVYGWMTIPSGGSGGVGPTNANQFGASTTLTIKDGALLTNTTVVGTLATTAETISTFLQMASSAPIIWGSLTRIVTSTDGFLTLINNAQNDFLGLRLGGTSAGSPMLGKTNGDFIVTGANGLDPAATNRLFVPGGIDVTRTNVLQAVPLAHFGTNVANGLTVRTNGTVQLDAPVLFGTDNTYDIGASGANRPRAGYLGTSLSVGANGFWNISGVRLETAGTFYWLNSSAIDSPSDGVIKVRNSAATDFNRLQLGGTTAAFPAIGRTNGDLVVFGADGLFGTNALVGGSSTNRLIVHGLTAAQSGTLYPTNALARFPTAATIGIGGHWVGNSNGFLVDIYSIDGAATIMKVLAP